MTFTRETARVASFATVSDALRFIAGRATANLPLFVRHHPANIDAFAVSYATGGTEYVAG